jgi:hypothetical protein
MPAELPPALRDLLDRQCGVVTAAQAAAHLTEAALR